MNHPVIFDHPLLNHLLNATRERRRDYRPKHVRVVDAIRDLRSITADEAKQIVTALEVRFSTELQVETQAVCDYLKCAGFTLRDLGIDQRDEATKSADYAYAQREMRDADRGLE